MDYLLNPSDCHMSYNNSPTVPEYLGRGIHFNTSQETNTVMLHTHTKEAHKESHGTFSKINIYANFFPEYWRMILNIPLLLTMNEWGIYQECQLT